MKDKDCISSLFNTTKEYINISLNSYYDNIGIIIDHYYRGEFNQIDDIETKRETYSKVTLEDIIKLNKKMNKSITYFLEGDMDEKDSI